MERAKGIEPSYEAWEASVLPLNYAREGPRAGPCDDTYSVAKAAPTSSGASLRRHEIAEMLAEPQSLALVVRGRAGAVELVALRRVAERLVNEATDRLAVLEQERHIAAAHFQHRARARSAVGTLTEARIEEAGVMDAELLALAERRVASRFEELKRLASTGE